MKPVERLSRGRGKTIIISSGQTSRVAWAAFAALVIAPAVLLTGCLTTEPPNSPTRENHFERTFTEPTVQSSAPAPARNRAEVVVPVKQPQKAAEAPKPRVEPVVQPKLVITSPKNTATDAAKKGPTPVAAVSVRAREEAPRPAAVSTVTAPQ